jgi:hypothetical protein
MSDEEHFFQRCERIKPEYRQSMYVRKNGRREAKRWKEKR